MSGTQMMRIGIAADHGGFELKSELEKNLKGAHYEVVDFGDRTLNPADDYPDFVIPLARAVARGDVARGVAICGSGVGVCMAANKIPGVRAALITDSFAAHQGVEDDDMNVMCLGGKVTGSALSWELVQTFLNAHFKGSKRFRRRLAKVAELDGYNAMRIGELPHRRSKADATRNVDLMRLTALSIERSRRPQQKPSEKANTRNVR
jgi:ribose 5-phosphate isomerase B